tara:strand:- start:23 stop:178 length:156 start_codon:yes stop_codon:yes gene_type:complete
MPIISPALQRGYCKEVVPKTLFRAKKFHPIPINMKNRYPATMSLDQEEILK